MSKCLTQFSSKLHKKENLIKICRHFGDAAIVSKQKNVQNVKLRKMHLNVQIVSCVQCL